MATYAELKAQLTGTDFLVYLIPDPHNQFERIPAYRNLAGTTGILNSKSMRSLGIEYSDLPKIVTVDKLATALKVGHPGVKNWSVLESAIASNTNKVLNEVDSRITTASVSVFNYKGKVTDKSELPAVNNKVGDVYIVSSEDNSEYVWVGGDDAHWEYLGSNVDNSLFATKEELQAAQDGFDTAISAEAATRATEDAALSTLISALTTTVSDLQSNLSTEATTRATADTALQTALDTEITNRTDADTQLTNTKLDKPNVRFIRSITTEVLIPNTKYYVKDGTLLGTLPSDASDGSEISVTVFQGGEKTVIFVPNGITLNGSTDAMALNAHIFEARFVFDKVSNDWIVF